jgi:hypothetical protein
VNTGSSQSPHSTADILKEGILIKLIENISKGKGGRKLGYEKPLEPNREESRKCKMKLNKTQIPQLRRTASGSG